MTYNIFIKCEVCGALIDLKWQVGYLPKSVFRVSCGRCKSAIEGILKTDEKPSFSYEIIKGEEIKGEEKKGLWDIGCDYIIPISGEIVTEKMRTGRDEYRPTPFLNVFKLVNFESFSDFCQRIRKSLLKIDIEKDRIDRINNLYVNKQYKYLKKMLKEDFDIFIKKDSTNRIVENKQIVDFSYFNYFGGNPKIKNKLESAYRTFKKLKSNNKSEYIKLLEFIDSDIDKIEKRIRESLKIFLENYNYFIPVILLEYMSDTVKNKVFEEYAITTVHFEDVRNLYLRIYENVMEISFVFVALNNIIHRGSYETINEGIIKNKKNIRQYIDMTKGNKMKYLKINEDFNVIIPNFDKDIRNAIGHEDIEYNVLDQKLVYKEGETYLIKYVYNIWECYELCVMIYKIITEIKMDILNNKLKK